MKNLVSLTVAISLTAVIMPSAAFDLSPGQPFPAVSLPSIDGGGEIGFRDQLGQKLMLHLFASW